MSVKFLGKIISRRFYKADFLWIFNMKKVKFGFGTK